jgi:hypothetical protein
MKNLPARYQHDLYVFLIVYETRLLLLNIDQDFRVIQNLQLFLYMNVNFSPITKDWLKSSSINNDVYYLMR